MINSPRLRLPGLGWLTDYTVLCSSSPAGTEETRRCFEAAGELGCRAWLPAPAAPWLTDAREAGVPVIGLPGIMQPRPPSPTCGRRRAEMAAVAGVATRLDGRVEAAAALLERRATDLEAPSAEDGRAPRRHPARGLRRRKTG